MFCLRAEELNVTALLIWNMDRSPKVMRSCPAGGGAVWYAFEIAPIEGEEEEEDDEEEEVLPPPCLTSCFFCKINMTMLSPTVFQCFST